MPKEFENCRLTAEDLESDLESQSCHLDELPPAPRTPSTHSQSRGFFICKTVMITFTL